MGTVLKGLPLSRYFRLRQEQLNADVCSVSETIAIDEVGEMPATLHEEVPTAADVINEKVPTTDAKEENVAKADVIDDNVSGSDAPSDSDEEQNVREHDDASTDGMEGQHGNVPGTETGDDADADVKPPATGLEGQHGNVPGTETGDDADADVKPPATGLEGQHGNVPGTETGDDADADVKPPATGLEAVLRVRKKMRKDPSFRVIFSPGRDVFDPPTLKMSKLSTGFTPTKVVQLTVDTQVRVVSVNAFHVFNGEESWTFIARDREERDLWTNSLVHAIHEAAAFGQDDMDFGEDLATWPSDVLELRTRFRGMQPRKVTLTGNELSICKITKGGKGTKACEAMTLFELSDVIPIDEDKDSKGVTRSLFRVTEYPWKTAKSWTFDAGSPDERAKWIALIEDAILETWAVFEGVEEGNSSDEQDAGAPPREWFLYPHSRGWTLGPNDPPLLPGQYLSNLSRKKPTTMEVTAIGDVLLSPGLYPDHQHEPLWAHRVTETFGGRANGGLGCAVEDWWQRHVMGHEIPVMLSVKNGRWRVGRGMMCTLGQSPAPKGSLRRFLPWDDRGKAVREGSLYLLDDDTFIITFGQNLLWDSKTA
eukprot:jgi/Undpi1/6505/HiC_scaffold_20.g08984.m1